MTGNQTKMAFGAVALLIVIAAATQVTRTNRNARNGKSGSADEGGRSNHYQSVSLSGHRSGHLGSSSASDKDHHTKINTIDEDEKTGDNGSSVTSIAFADTATSGAIPGETEQQTRDRERYEAAQAHAFKYRVLDPKKIKPTELDPVLQDATQKYNLPKNLLAATMFVETGGTYRNGDHSIDAGYGVMNLRESNVVDTAAEAAALLGKSKEDVFYDQKLNIEAAAALIAKYHDQALAAGMSDSEAYYTALAEYSGIPDPDLASSLPDEVSAALIKGFEMHPTDGGGSVVVPPDPNPLFLPKNYKLVGMSPPTAGSGPVPLPGTMPPSGMGAGSLP